MARRVRIYMVGVFLGLIIAYSLFIANGDRDLDIWTPNSRILEEIRWSKVSYSKKAKCLLECDTVIQNAYDYMIKEGDVAFDESNPRTIPSTYIVYSENELLRVTFETVDSSAFVKSIETELAKNCNCN